jgi:putative transcriptional regulator
MSEKAFSKMMCGLKEAKAYMEGERQGYKVTVPPSVDVKSIRKGLRMTQAAFSASFGFSLDTVKHWEGGRRTPEVPARAYLTVIQRNPSAVLEALHPAATTSKQTEVALGRKA